MCDFKPGDEVVCVDASPSVFVTDGRAPPLTENAVYTVLDVFEARKVLSREMSGVTGVALKGMEWSINGLRGGYMPSRFRKVQKRNDRLTIEAFSTIKDGFEEPRRAPAKKRERVQ